MLLSATRVSCHPLPDLGALPQSAPTPTDPSEDTSPSSPDAPPDLDFSRIDTPQEAALMPALNAASFLLQLNAITSAIKGGLAVTSSVHMAMGESTQAHIDYQMSDPKDMSFEGHGIIGDQVVHETWAYDAEEGGWTIGGSIGDRFENLLLTSSGNGNLRLRGTVDHIKVSQAIVPSPDGSSVSFRGRIGDQPLDQTLTFAQDEQGHIQMKVSGMLGDLPIAFENTLHVSNDRSHAFFGEGIVAGVPVEMIDGIILGPVDGGSTPHA